MPHIVLENIDNTRKAFDAVTRFAEKTENGILKVMDKYINDKELKKFILNPEK